MKRWNCWRRWGWECGRSWRFASGWMSLFGDDALELLAAVGLGMREGLAGLLVVGGVGERVRGMDESAWE
ncbi:MAG: hypothetical protein NTV52_13880 [Acidobacteria bacterium]|nr:hypothetical protein [Acidobacteriota bacterium]